jgi:hypothetical protein
MIQLNEDALKTSARKYRKELLKMPVLALGSSLQHMSLRTGIRYSETVGELSGNLEFGPYSESREDSDAMILNPRTLYTYLGSVVKNFSPNSIAQTFWGSDFTKGDGLKSTDITLDVVSYLAAQLGKNLNQRLFDAVRNEAGNTSKDLFNGFDTIAKTELDNKKLDVSLGNLVKIEAIDKTNAVDTLKAICRAADDVLADEEELKLFVPKHVFNDYCDDYQLTVGAMPYNREFKKLTVEGFDNVQIVALANKKNSPFIQLTPQRNMLVGVNQTGEEENIEIARFKAFVLQFIATMFIGCEYESISKERLLMATIDGTTAI